MDTQKIGKFLQALRKEKHLTQEQLGEQLGVTNKTVSRWETGTYLPPVECLTFLSSLYQVSINEILAGKRLEECEYRKASEDNITVALEEMAQEEKRFERWMLTIMAITTIFAMAIMFLLPHGQDLSAAEKIKGILVIVLVAGLAAISNTLNLVAMVLRKKK